MATVKVNINSVTIISALNTPGGAVFDWRDNVGRLAKTLAIGASPVNDPANAQHRGGLVGTFKASWDWDRIGSNGHQVRARLFNTSDHAAVVEFGRRTAFGQQVFSWTRFKPPGATRRRFVTRGREGNHIAKYAAEEAVAQLA